MKSDQSANSKCSSDCFVVQGNDLGISDGDTRFVIEEGTLSVEIKSRKTEPPQKEFRISHLAFPTPRLERSLTLPPEPGSPNYPSVWEEGFDFGARFFGSLTFSGGWMKLEGTVKQSYESDENGVRIRICKKLPFVDGADPGQYTFTDLTEAEQVGPENVRQLNLDLATLPESFDLLQRLGNLPRLEHLNLSTPRENFPEGLGRLHSLKTLFLSYSGRGVVEELPGDIFTLVNLEALFINGGLKTLSPEISRLASLKKLYLSGNQLKTLPEEIGKMPSLKELNINYNPFQSLPANLINIPELTVEHRHKALFMDVSYKSRNPNPIQAELYLARADQETQGRLRSALMKSQLEKYIDAASAEARLAVALKATEPEKEIEIGRSRIGGLPDLPSGFEYPMTDGKLWSFMAQIDLEEIAHLQGYLPRRGLLSFFSEDPIQNPEAVRVHLFTEERDMLRRFSLPEEAQFIDESLEDGNPYPGFRLAAEKAISLPYLYSDENRLTKEGESLLQIRESDHEDEVYSKLREELVHDGKFSGHGINRHVFTQHESPEEQAAAAKGGSHEEWMVLLSLDSDPKVRFQFWDSGTLTFCIHKKDLAIGDFSNIHASIYSS